MITTKELNGPGIILDSLPRTGSTTIATLLGSHPDVRCVMEPFHPLRFGGSFHGMARDSASLASTMGLLWSKWNLVKHVWESEDRWPFRDRPFLNEEILFHARKVILLRRRNLLQRYVSGVISKHIHYWIGPRDTFETRLRYVTISALDHDLVRRQLIEDSEAIEKRIAFLESHSIPHLEIVYEDLFEVNVGWAKRIEQFNGLFAVLGYAPLDTKFFLEHCSKWLDPAVYKWASPETYRHVSGIEELDRAVGADGTGWLFK